MEYWTNYEEHESVIAGKRKKVDNTIYSFDIETTSYCVTDVGVVPAINYLKLPKKVQQNSIKQSNMYIWMFGVNEQVYFGRTWGEFKEFIERIENNCNEKKIIFVHNLSFEFQYIRKYFKIAKVQARKKRKTMKVILADYNIEFRCTYMMSNAALAQLPKLFKLPVEKKVGDLDYNLIRHSKTTLTEKELGYCEYDCLVVYHYILKELDEYERVDKIPVTSTGKVRRELKELTQTDFGYKRQVYKAINTDPHVYNMLTDAFAGGYTHANWLYVGDVLNNLDSWDFTSSYPYVLVSYKYPSTEFKKCNITKRVQMLDRFAYLLKVRFKNLKSKYYNNFISASKCSYIKGAKYDNGRIMQAEEIEITLTDVDFKFFLDSYKIEDYEIEESYYSVYKYLPTQFINFVLQKYVNKTQYKNVKGKELEYSKEKNKFNSLYGMSVTNLIRATVEYTDKWEEDKELTNVEIEELLLKEKKKSFLSFAYGVWVTAYARNNLLRNVLKCDEYVVYCDTDSMKLIEGYDKTVIEDYNKDVMRRIKRVSEELNIDIEKFMPVDVFGEKHPLGVFDSDGHYEEFITLGAKKYAYRQYENIYKFKKDYCFKKEHNLHITVAGVPKKGVKALENNINNFTDNLLFDYTMTGKQTLVFADEQDPIELTDYLGNKLVVEDKSGCCLLPCTYILKNSLVYAEKCGDSSARARYKE